MTLFLTISEFTDFSVAYLRAYVDKAIEGNQKVLPIHIESFGGSVYHCNAMLSILDSAKEKGLKIATITAGFAFSCGSFLFSAGSPGLRFVGKNASLMIHEPSYFEMGKSGSHKTRNQEVERIKSNVMAIMDKQSNQEPGYWQKLIDENNNNDLYLSAEQAVEHGLASEIGLPEINKLSEGKQPEMSGSLQIYMSLNKPEIIQTADEPVERRYKPMDLNELKASLDPSQASLIAKLEAQAIEAKNNQQIAESKLEALKGDMKKSQENKNKMVLGQLLHSQKISKKDHDRELAFLNKLPTSELQDEYLNKLSADKRDSIIGEDLNDAEEKKVDLSNGSWKSDPEAVEAKFGVFMKAKGFPTASGEQLKALWTEFCDQHDLKDEG